MKNFILLSLFILLFFTIEACSKKEPVPTKDYTVKIIYTNGDIETSTFTLPEDSKIKMEKFDSSRGSEICLKAYSETEGWYFLERCGIRTFVVLN